MGSAVVLRELMLFEWTSCLLFTQTVGNFWIKLFHNFGRCLALQALPKNPASQTYDFLSNKKKN